jgi:hypothetical protein
MSGESTKSFGTDGLAANARAAASSAAKPDAVREKVRYGAGSSGTCANEETPLLNVDEDDDDADVNRDATVADRLE